MSDGVLEEEGEHNTKISRLGQKGQISIHTIAYTYSGLVLVNKWIGAWDKKLPMAIIGL